MTKEEFIKDIRTGIADTLPEPQAYDPSINHAPKRKDILTQEEKKLCTTQCPALFSKEVSCSISTRVCGGVTPIWSYLYVPFPPYL